MLSLELTLATPPGRGRTVAQALRALMLPLQSDHRCVGCRVFVCLEELDRLFYVEEWASEDDLRRRVLSPRFAQLLELLEIANEPPRFEFRNAGQIYPGLAYVRQVRQGVARGAAREATDDTSLP